jgi:hypothetical protein
MSDDTYWFKENDVIVYIYIYMSDDDDDNDHGTTIE